MEAKSTPFFLGRQCRLSPVARRVLAPSPEVIEDGMATHVQALADRLGEVLLGQLNRFGERMPDGAIASDGGSASAARAMRGNAFDKGGGER